MNDQRRRKRCVGKKEGIKEEELRVGRKAEGSEAVNEGKIYLLAQIET